MGHMHSVATGDRPRPQSARDREGGLLARLHWNHEKGGGLVRSRLQAAPRRPFGRGQSVFHTLLSSFTTSS